MSLQAERALQQEVMLRLRAGGWPVICIPVPNGIWIPARTEAERKLVARIIARMKADGMLLPGAFDLVVLWDGGGGMIDLKRPKSRDLFRTRPAGRPTDTQIELADQAAALGVNHAYCTSWEEVRDRLRDWGVAPVQPYDEIADAIGSYNDAVRAVGDKVRAGEPVPPFFRSDKPEAAE